MRLRARSGRGADALRGDAQADGGGGGGGGGIDEPGAGVLGDGGVGAGGADAPKFALGAWSKLTFGTLRSASSASKYSRCRNVPILAISTVGKVCSLLLYFKTLSL